MTLKLDFLTQPRGAALLRQMVSNRREAEEVEARQTLLQVESRFTETLGTSQQCCRCVKLTVQPTCSICTIRQRSTS